MGETANVVIIGGGVIGTSIAYYLARKGCRDVILCEKEKFLAAGTTGLSVGGIRAQFSRETNVRLSLYSVPFFERFREEMGVDPGLHQVGYLFLLSTEEEVEMFQVNVALQKSLGVEVELISPGEAKEMVPQLNVEDLKGATFGPRDGYADPSSVTHGFAQQARDLGVDIRLETEVTGIEVEKGKVRGVLTRHGAIAAPVVVNAAGPYAHLVGKMAGVDLPAHPYRRQVFFIESLPAIPPTTPMVIDFHKSWYFRKEGPGIVFGMSDPDEPSSFNLNVDWEFMLKVVEYAAHRVPVLAEAQISRSWAGLYCITPDANPILGSIPAVEGFICAVGFSGHGFMHSPATGLLIAELIVDGRASTVDISPLSVERFETGEVAAERHVI
ncbi:MAG: NAD(P)/FAD-dependent oxidoreductase [Anaerolineae bacterium]